MKRTEEMMAMVLTLVGMLTLMFWMIVLPAHAVDAEVSDWYAVAGTEKTHGEMTGKWVSMETICGETYACEYAFYADGTYAYVDEAIRYEEQGEYEIQDNCLILTRADGGVEVYRLDLSGHTFYDMSEDETLVFAREIPTAQTMANASTR